MDEQDLLYKKKEIEKAKTTLAESKGEEKALLKQLKEKWGCDDLPKAKKKIEKYRGEIIELKEQIETDTKELEETYFNGEE